MFCLTALRQLLFQYLVVRDIEVRDILGQYDLALEDIVLVQIIVPYIFGIQERVYWKFIFFKDPVSSPYFKPVIFESVSRCSASTSLYSSALP